MTITPIDLTQRLAGKVAVITGGASGIGLATAKRFAAEGAKVVIGDVDPTSGQAAAELVDGLFVQVDVTDKEKVDALFDAAASSYGSVDIADDDPRALGGEALRGGEADAAGSARDDGDLAGEALGEVDRGDGHGS